jgi:predicted transposase/invertase (TIGR01784 family)
LNEWAIGSYIAYWFRADRILGTLQSCTIVLIWNDRDRPSSKLYNDAMYDNTCRFLAENFSADFASWLMGEAIVLTEIEPSELSLDPIRADALILLQSEDSILHIEFQTDPQKKIPFRMLDYRCRGHRRYPDKSMRQVVIYLKPTTSELVSQTAFTLERTRHEFDVIRLWEQPASLFLQYPGLLPFATLSNTPDSEAMLRQVAIAIDQIQDPAAQVSLSAASAILAGLRLEDNIVYQILRRDIMEESSVYRSIVAEGAAKATREIAINLLQAGLTVTLISSSTGLSIEEVQLLQQDLNTTSAV